MTAVSGEPAEIDLDRLPPGEHTAVLTIWAPRGKAAAAVIPLPRLTCPSAADRIPLAADRIPLAAGSLAASAGGGWSVSCAGLAVGDLT